jgi:adenosine deaminase/aminodeoxyfutalosine deaminase
MHSAGNDFCDRLEKAELHLHLEGSIEPETLAEIAPGRSLDEVRAKYRYSDFSGFLQAFKWVVQHLNSPDDYALAARRLFESLRRQNVRYAEVTLSAGVVLWRKQSFAAVYDAVTAEAARSGVEIWWVLDAVRQFGLEPAWEVARLAAERVGDRVVAFGIGGDEAAAPAGQFRDIFRFALDHGLKLVPHAGEACGPESIWEALEGGAHRIGHGIAAAQDTALMRHLREADIALEVCVSSNVCTGVRTRETHPVRRLFDAGVPMVLASDDPAMFATSLSGEYALARDAYGFSEPELAALAQASFRYAFQARR